MYELLMSLSLTASQDDSCFNFGCLMDGSGCIAEFEPIGTFCGPASSCDGEGHCIFAVCEICAAEPECIMYASCLQGFNSCPDYCSESLLWGQMVFETCT